MNHRALALAGVLLVALAVRLGAMMTQTYVIFADETFQYLEQGHRLAFGDGIVPWEYHDGIRSWLLPGMIAGLMRVGAWIGRDPLVYLWLVRGVCVALSLSVVWAGFRLGEQIGGLSAALLSGLFAAVWFDLVWFAPVVLTETLAAHLVILAVIAADIRHPAGWSRRHLLAGALLGCAVCLRYQYAPVIAVIAIAQFRLSWPQWRDAAIGGVVVAAFGAGLLDWLTWGAPFQSIWLHFLRNTVDGVGSAMGTDPPTYYLAYLLTAYWPAPLLLGPAAYGATRAPALGLAALTTVLIHTAVPHKEVRFIYLALAVTPILIGCGTILLLQRLPIGAMPHRMAHSPSRPGGHDHAGDQPRPNLASPYGWACLSIAALAWGALSLAGATGPALVARWSLNRGPVEAFLAASRLPALCGLAARDMRLIDTGGYAYLHRDVPLYFEDSADQITLSGSRVALRFSVERGGQAERPSAIREGGGYNAMIAREDRGDPGLARIACFPDPAHPNETPICLFHDAGRPCR